MVIGPDVLEIATTIIPQKKIGKPPIKVMKKPLLRYLLNSGHILALSWLQHHELMITHEKESGAT